MPGLAAIVLAAGGSSRMGRPKQLLPVGGQTMLARTVDVARAAGCACVVVVLGRDAAACRPAVAGVPGVIAVDNPQWAVGMGSSLRVGAAAVPLDASAVFVLLVDQPLVTAATLGRLLAARPDDPAAVAVAAFADTLGPPVLAGAAWLAALRDWPEAEGAKRLWTANPAALRVPCPESAADVDTAADYAALVPFPGTQVEG